MATTPGQKAAIAALVIEREGSQLSPYELRELERVITSRATSRERFIQKVKSPTFHWKKPEPRRR